MKSVGLPGFAAAEEEDDSEMQPLSSDDDAECHSTEAALEYISLGGVPALRAKERLCHILLKKPPCFLRLPCLTTSDWSTEAIRTCALDVEGRVVECISEQRRR